MNKFFNKAIYKYIVPVIMLCFSVLLFEPLNVHAENDLVSYSYTGTCYCSTSSHKDYLGCYQDEMSFEVSSGANAIITRFNNSKGGYYYSIFVYGKYSDNIIVNSSCYRIGLGPGHSDYTPTLRTKSYSPSSDSHYKYFTYNGEQYVYFYLTSFMSVTDSTYHSYTLPDIPTYYIDAECGGLPDYSIPSNFFLDIVSGTLEPDYSPSVPDEPLGPGLELVKHNFANDIINPDIPVPQLTKISHEGFTLGNREGYAAEVIMESSLLGVQFEKQHIGMGVSDTWGFAPDDDWIYQGFYYNIADSSDVLIDSDVVNIKELYGHDNLANLIQAFKVYGEEYPKANTLPSYTWLKAGYNTQYAANHVYKSDSELSDLDQLKKSGQAVTSYYVRYVDSSGNTGRWVKYSFQDAYGTINNGMVYEGSVDVGVVEPDVNGNPVVRDEVSGSVDYDNDGEISYTPPESSLTPTVPEGEIDDSLESFNDVLEHFSDSVTNVSNFVSSMFSFLPSWTISLLGLALGAVVMLRFLGR